MSMEKMTCTIMNEEGLHARPAGVLAKTAACFQSKIELIVGGKTINAKSIMSIMSGGIHGGQEVTFQADGPDAKEAIARIQTLVESKFS